MPQILHGNAVLTIHQRRYIQESNKSIRKLANELGVSVPTVMKWKHREDFEDRKAGPKNPKTSFEDWQEEVIVEVRKRLLVPVDDLLEITGRYIKPDCSRSSFLRLLKRRSLPSLRQIQRSKGEDDSPRKFKDYKPV